ncbi:MAG: Type 1 glutamine amidotransferase-like domain-containing protein [Chloroflexi bacterium]|nr:Type 1 glutamine amidotransferase-like domain-containing protein [Chloroflexota bacterium]MCC6897285.1 Type 1 glutamine amidotransferase-like domain-containing protein [Anaerolineae bacterium]
MKMLLTSAGIRNKTINAALLDLLGKPIAECNALCNSTASYPLDRAFNRVWEFVTGNEPITPMCELGWKSLGVLELTALPSISKDVWVPMVQQADVLLVNGGDTVYLAYWMRQSGFADLFPSLNLVYVGLSAGSVVMTPRIAKEFIHWTQPSSEHEPLGLVDFEIFPHLDYPTLPTHAMAYAEKWAAHIQSPGYAIDDETAIKVVDGKVDVITEGKWKLFTP